MATAQELLAGAPLPPSDVFPDARPAVRWWWLKGPFRRRDITGQLEWLRARGFGGVECAWLRPLWLTEPDAPEPPAEASAAERAVLADVDVASARAALGERCGPSELRACPLPGCGNQRSFQAEGPSWLCFACQASGDVVDLAAALLETERAAAAAWLAAELDLDLDEANLPIARPGWLTPAFSELIAHAKAEAERLGLGCDFTFGSCWPFGGHFLQPADRAQTLTGPSTQRLGSSWDEEPAWVLDHLSRGALERYAATLAPAFARALEGRTSALFCDSLEVEKEALWSSGLGDVFEARFGRPPPASSAELRGDPHLRYAYRALIGETILDAFYAAFTDVCRRLGARSRVQCHGAPTDLLAAYAAADVPESEAILFNPWFSRIAASAAALSGRPVVSCETFTCLYGFITRANLLPLTFWKAEQVADLKLLADAVLANGVNQVVWHGMPYNAPGGTHEFYASIHVGPGCAFEAELPAFNAYLERACGALRLGSPLTGLAVYLPNEDAMMRGDLPSEERTPGAVDHWEMRGVQVPPAAEGYLPLWVSLPFLRSGRVEGEALVCGPLRFPGLLLDVEWLDRDALREVLRLAQAGLRIVLARRPWQPGLDPDPEFDARLAALTALPSVHATLAASGLQPLIAGEELPYCWGRAFEAGWLLFFAHPRARGLSYPMTYGESADAQREVRRVTLATPAGPRDVTLTFEPGESLLLRVSEAGDVEPLDLGYQAPPPRREPP